MKKTNKRTLAELKVQSFITTDKIIVRGGEDNPTCIPETCTTCPGELAFA